MKYSTIIIQLLACVSLSDAFSPTFRQNKLILTTKTRPQRVLFSSQWEDEDDNEEVATKNVSFDDAGEALRNEDDELRLSESGDGYDANPEYRVSDIDRVRAAIKQRTEALGIEEATVSKEMIQAAQERAQKAMAEGRMGDDSTMRPQFLDLTQISEFGGPRGEREDVPSMFYEPEDEMTEEEMREADPVGYLPFMEQFNEEFSKIQWPSPLDALKELALLFVFGIGTGLLIVEWDSFLRELYTNWGIIPGKEEIMQGTENLVLPDGWTNGMTEDDFMNFQDQVGSAASSVAPLISGSAPSDIPEL